MIRYELSGGSRCLAWLLSTPRLLDPHVRRLRRRCAASRSLHRILIARLELGRGGGTNTTCSKIPSSGPSFSGSSMAAAVTGWAAAVGKLNQPRFDHMVVTVGDALYAVGGRGSSLGTSENQFDLGAHLLYVPFLLSPRHTPPARCACTRPR